MSFPPLPWSLCTASQTTSPCELALQFRLGLRHINQILVLGEFVVMVQTLRIQKRPRRLDVLARHDLFDRQLDLLPIDRRLHET